MELIDQVTGGHTLRRLDNKVSFESICSCRGCSNTSTIQIRLPINERLAYTLTICDECLPKFSIDDDNKIDSSRRETIGEN